MPEASDSDSKVILDSDSCRWMDENRSLDDKSHSECKQNSELCRFTIFCFLRVLPAMKHYVE